MDEYKVVHVGDEAHHPLATLGEDFLFEGDEEAIFHLWHGLKLFVSWILGVGPGQIAQHVPAVC